MVIYHYSVEAVRSISWLVLTRLSPISKKPVAAKSSMRSSGINFAIEPPNNTPSNEASTKAKDDPRKTANGRWLDPLIAKVAI